MTPYSNWALAAALAGGLIGGAAPAQAQVNMREPDPAVWLRQVYDLYQRAEKSPALQERATFRLVVKTGLEIARGAVQEERRLRSGGEGHLRD